MSFNLFIPPQERAGTAPTPGPVPRSKSPRAGRNSTCACVSITLAGMARRRSTPGPRKDRTPSPKAAHPGQIAT